jgi:hypothetical protein
MAIYMTPLIPRLVLYRILARLVIVLLFFYALNIVTMRVWEIQGTETGGQLDYNSWTSFEIVVPTFLYRA